MLPVRAGGRPGVDGRARSVGLLSIQYAHLIKLASEALAHTFGVMALSVSATDNKDGSLVPARLGGNGTLLVRFASSLFWWEGRK